jgi:hypothetical protein
VDWRRRCVRLDDGRILWMRQAEGVVRAGRESGTLEHPTVVDAPGVPSSASGG